MIPDFETIAQRLSEAKLIEAYLTPQRAFMLVSLLQLALRHPALKQDLPAAAEVAESMAAGLMAKLGEIDPAIAAALNQGFDESLDSTPEEFEAMQAGARVVLHNVYTLYELNPDGSRAEPPLLSFSRPQNWGDPGCWHYHQCKVELKIGETTYVNNCHIWQEVERDLVKACAAIGEAMYWCMQPGQPWQLCGREFLAEEDFWSEEWGEMPPVYDNEPGQNYEDYSDPISVGGQLYCWRVWHPNQEQAVAEAEANPFSEPPFPSAQPLYELTQEGDRFVMRDDDEQPLCGILFGTHLKGTPVLAQSWADKGWQLESQAAMTQIGE